MCFKFKPKVTKPYFFLQMVKTNKYVVNFEFLLMKLKINSKINSFRILIFFSVIISGCNLKPNNSPTTLKVVSSIRAIEVVDDSLVCFAGSKGVFGITKNGGKSWFVDTIKHPKVDLNFRSIGYTNSALIVGAINSPSLFLRSTDFGITWDTVYKELHPKAFYNCIKFWDENNGIAVGDETEGCLSIVTTKDGGKTWQKRICDSSIYVSDGEANFAASNSNIAVFKNHCWIATGGKKARVFYSIDYGESWTNYQTPIIQGEQMIGIYSIDFYDENLGFVIGGDWNNKNSFVKNKAITTDGGKTWRLVADGKYPGYRSCAHFDPKGKGEKLLVVGPTGISESLDTGKTWNHISDSGFYALEFSPSGNTIWMSGKNKVVKY